MASGSIASVISYIKRPLSWASRARLAPVIMVGGIAVAAWGQYVLLSEPEFALRGALLMAGGGLAFLAALLMGWQSLGAEALLDDEQEESAATSFSWGLRQQVGLAVGILGGLAGFLLNGDNTFTTWGFSLWVIGCLAIVLAFWPPRGRLQFRLPSLQPSSAWAPVALLLILGLAAFFRFYDLDNTIREMVRDHALVIFDVQTIHDGAHPVYITAARGREALFFYMSAGLVPFLGYSFLHLKILSAAVGVIAVAATYFMTKELFGNRRVALIAAILVSLSFWHIILSRLGFPFTLHPLTVALMLTFLFRALKYNRSSDFVFSGVFLGLGLWTYAAARAVPLAVALILTVSLLSRFLSKRAERLAFLVNSALLVVTALVVYAPLGRFALDAPDSYWDRTGDQIGEQGDTLAVLGDHIKRTLLMFNWQGSEPGLLHPSDFPAQLDYLTGAAFAVGVGAMALFWVLRRRGLNAHASVAFFVMLVPSFAVLNFTHEVPSASRASGVIPLVFAVAALPLYIGSEFLVKAFGRLGLVAAVGLLGVALGLIGYMNYNTYFNDYADFNARQSLNQTEVAAVFRDFEQAGGDLDNAYLKAQPNWINTLVLAIELEDIDWQSAFYEIGAVRDHALNPEAKLYVVHPDDGTGFLRLREIYPRGTAYRFESSRSEPGQYSRIFNFFVILVPAAGEVPMAPLPNTRPVR